MSDDTSANEPFEQCDHCHRAYPRRLIYRVRQEKLCAECGQKQIDSWNKIVKEAS